MKVLVVHSQPSSWTSAPSKAIHIRICNKDVTCVPVPNMNGPQGKINEITFCTCISGVYVCVRSLWTLLVRADFTSNEFCIENTTAACKKSVFRDFGADMI